MEQESSSSWGHKARRRGPLHPTPCLLNKQPRLASPRLVPRLSLMSSIFTHNALHGSTPRPRGRSDTIAGTAPRRSLFIVCITSDLRNRCFLFTAILMSLSFSVICVNFIWKHDYGDEGGTFVSVGNVERLSLWLTKYLIGHIFVKTSLLMALEFQTV